MDTKTRIPTTYFGTNHRRYSCTGTCTVTGYVSHLPLLVLHLYCTIRTGTTGCPRLRSCMKTAPEAYHLCAEKGASLCKAPSWILLLQSSVSLPTLESAPHTRLPCISLSLPIETMRAFGQLWAPRSHISALIPAFSFLVISVGWLLYRHGWPAVAHGRWRCRPTRNR